MIQFNTILEHQDTLSILCINDLTFAGIGGTIYVYKNEVFVISCKIWQGQKIHVIKGDTQNEIYVVGGKYIALCSYDFKDFKVFHKIKSVDWIYDVIPHSPHNILLLSSHNQVYSYNLSTRQISEVKSTSEKCILYSGIFHFIGDELNVLAGTVFSETLVWPVADVNSDIPSKITKRVKGHKGVIFSISARNLGNEKYIICTTSDDRTAIISFHINSDSEENVIFQSLQGHSARVWKSLMTEENIFTIGEDSLICSWSYDGTLIKKSELSSCGGIRSICVGNTINNVLVGGCDGSVHSILSDTLLSKTSSQLIQHNFGSGFPRKVAFINGSIVCLTDQSLLQLKCCFKLENDVYCKSIKLIYKCTDLSSSNCGKYFALATACGRLIIYNSEDENPQEFEIGNGHRCEVVKWSDYSLLVQNTGGDLNLFQKINNTFQLTSSYTLKRNKERSLTCFLLFDSFTLVGDRTGNLHVYSEKETLLQTIFKLHGPQGISEIFKKIDTVLTAGAGGKIRELGFADGTICLLRSFNLPMEMASKIISTSTGIIIAGFQGSNFQLWDFDNRIVLSSLKCGGGHRSYDFQLIDNKLYFVYIKNKQLFQASFPISFCKVIRNSYHSKIINCLSTITGFRYPILVSGSDDNTVRIVEIYEHDINPINIIEQHISSIRALRIVMLSEQKYLIISVGGREQITFTEFNCETRGCKESLSYLPKSTIADSRFMCIEVVKVSNEKLLIFLGCSDCTIRILQFNGSVIEIGLLRYTHCILQILILENFLVTFSTDGKGVFWDIREFLDSNGPLPPSPIVTFPLHQSGINSIAIKQSSDKKYLLATGGDDSLLKLTMFELSEKDTVPWKLISKWDNRESHACQITGLLFTENLLISTALDQRVIVHQLHEKPHGDIETQIMGETITCTPDAHGLSLISETSSTITICIFGKGIEVIDVQLLES